MNKSAKFCVFAALCTVPAGSILTACRPFEAQSTGAAGEVEFRYLIGDGVEVNTLNYMVSHPDAEDIHGQVPVGEDSTVEFTLGGLTHGAGYTILVSAMSTDGKAFCEGEAEFDIQTGRHSRVDVIMSCVVAAPDPWEVDVGVGLNVCPYLTSIAIAPSSQCVGEAIELVAAATDPDGPALSYTWRVNGVTKGAGAASVYTCEEPGSKALEVHVSDSHCSDTYSTTITCERCDGDTGSEETGGTGSDGTYWGLSENCDRCMDLYCDLTFWDGVRSCPHDDLDCRAVFECKLENACITPQLGSIPCYCGAIDRVTDCADPLYLPEPDGPCRELIENSHGTDVRPDIVGNWDWSLVGAGRAAAAASCMARTCFDACLRDR
ncbi:MAG: hypothetical protein B7733_08360 [Myxococcales bacterium FL481]|nr:MAG: hypothetical protein B7733_08360 [Myxococcales bacterium FL481]